jgi:hypothetical protein
MRAGYAWLASFLVFPLAGAPLLTARAFRVFGLPTRAVLSGGVGMVLTSWTMTVFALLGLRWGPLVVLLATAFGLALRLVLKKEGNQADPSPHLRGEGWGEGRSSRATALLASALIAISLLASLAATVAGRSTSPDLLLFWGPKAQQFASARTIDVGFLAAPFLEYLHIYYPPLVTNVYAFGAMAAGRFPWGAATLTFPLLLGATAVGVAGVLKTEVSPARAAATSALATSAIALLGIHAAVAGNGEPFLLFFEIIAVALLLTPAAATAGGKLVAGLLLAGAATSKVEGLPFLAATVALFLFIERERRGKVVRASLLLLGPAAVALGTWFAFGALRRLFLGYQGYGRFLDLRWHHFDEVVSGFALAFWKNGYALPFAVPLLVLVLTRGKPRRALLPIGVAAVLAAFLLFTYLHYEQDPRLWISWSAARVFSPLTALLSLAAYCSRPRSGAAAARER